MKVKEKINDVGHFSSVKDHESVIMLCSKYYVTSQIWKVAAVGEKHYWRLVNDKPQLKIVKLLGSRGR